MRKKINFLDKISVGHHSEGFENVETSLGNRERGRDREFARFCVFYVFISDANNSKNVYFYVKMRKTINFLDKISVGDHSEGLENVETSLG